MITTYKFSIIENNGNGNCVFETISYFVNLYKSSDHIVNSSHIRQSVASFYNAFERNIEYQRGTIEEAILLALQFDNDEAHEINVRNDSVSANFVDILVASLVFKFDIHLYRRRRNNDFFVEIISYQYSNKNTIDVLFTNNNIVSHFEALIYK